MRGYVEDDQEIIASTINMAEIYRWILRFYNQDIAEEKRSAIKDRCSVIAVDEEIAIDAARIKYNPGWGFCDSIIYATARHENAKVLTCDSDFQGQEGVIFLDRGQLDD